MSVHGLSEDELDLLADFTAGVLAPTEHHRVARLVGTDARWAAAHRALLGADGAVRADLRAIAGPLTMPVDVAARMDAAIARLGPVATGHDRVVTPLSHARSAQPRSRHTRARAGRRSPWRRFGIAVTGVAAAVIVLGGGFAVVNQLARQTATGTNAAGADSQLGAAAPNLAGGPATIHSGRNYQPGTLGQLAQGYRAVPPPAAVAPTPSVAAAPGVANGPTGPTSQSDAKGQGAESAQSAERVPGQAALDRLANPDALRACLAAIQQSHPGTPTVVDFAAFQGAPALVIVVQQGGGWVVVVVGAACGVSGADERYAATVGP